MERLDVEPGIPRENVEVDLVERVLGSVPPPVAADLLGALVVELEKGKADSVERLIGVAARPADFGVDARLFLHDRARERLELGRRPPREPAPPPFFPPPA